MQLKLDLAKTIKQDALITKKVSDYLPWYSPSITKIISKILRERKMTDETLGDFFQKLTDKVEKKSSGQFYTPQKVVDYIISFLNIKSDSKILDPTCGCGIFLLTVYRYLKKINKKALENIYGVDLNKDAVEITRLNLWLRDGVKPERIKILEGNIKTGNSIIENQRLDKRAFKWSEEFKEVINRGGFDFIIGNPPYLTLKKNKNYDIKESSFAKIANGPINAASLVIVRSFNLLKKDGIIAFVLPKTLLRVNSYFKLREFISTKSKILHIVDLGNYFKNVRGEQILLFLQKTKNKDEIKKNKILIKILNSKSESLIKQQGFYISQNLFKKYKDFLILREKEHYSLIDKIHNSGQPLERLADIFRGLSISPTSKLIQKNTMNGEEPIIKGNNISKLKVTPKYFIDSKRLNNNSSKLNRLRKAKIILQNIFSSEAGIIAALDPYGYLTLNTVTNVTISNPCLTLKYLIGILNSKLINFYLIYAIFHGSKLTMHTDKTYMGRLPIKLISNSEQEELGKIIDSFNKKGDKTALKKIDKIVYNIYRLKREEQKIIENSLQKTMSSKSYW